MRVPWFTLSKGRRGRSLSYARYCMNGKSPYRRKTGCMEGRDSRKLRGIDARDNTCLTFLLLGSIVFTTAV